MNWKACHLKRVVELLPRPTVELIPSCRARTIQGDQEQLAEFLRETAQKANNPLQPQARRDRRDDATRRTVRIPRGRMKKDPRREPRGQVSEIEERKMPKGLKAVSRDLSGIVFPSAAQDATFCGIEIEVDGLLAAQRGFVGERCLGGDHLCETPDSRPARCHARRAAVSGSGQCLRDLIGHRAAASRTQTTCRTRSDRRG